MIMTQLESNSKDKLVSVAKAAAGALPFIGNAVSELLDNVVPNLRFERVVVFLQSLDQRVSRLDEKMEQFRANLATEEGIDLLEEGILQASRSISPVRKKRLASILETSLSEETLKYEESKKILNLFREMTDPEIIWLIYYSLRPNIGRGPHSDWVAKHPDVLDPISRELSAPKEQREKAALQDSYKETLLRLGLVETNGRTTNLTTLGGMVVRYISDGEDN